MRPMKSVVCDARLLSSSSVVLCKVSSCELTELSGNRFGLSVTGDAGSTELVPSVKKASLASFIDHPGSLGMSCRGDSSLVSDNNFGASLEGGVLISAKDSNSTSLGNDRNDGGDIIGLAGSLQPDSKNEGEKREGVRHSRGSPRLLVLGSDSIDCHCSCCPPSSICVQAWLPPMSSARGSFRDRSGRVWP